MANWIVYDTATGEIRSSNEGGNARDRFWEAATDGRLSAIQTVDLIEDTWAWRVEHGKIVPQGLQERRRVEKMTAWFAFRRARNARLEATDYMLAPDYPLSREAQRALKAKRKASRDIPQKTTNPKLAMQMLQTIWSET